VLRVDTRQMRKQISEKLFHFGKKRDYLCRGKLEKCVNPIIVLNVNESKSRTECCRYRSNDFRVDLMSFISHSFNIYQVTAKLYTYKYSIGMD